MYELLLLQMVTPHHVMHSLFESVQFVRIPEGGAINQQWAINVVVKVVIPK